MSRSELTPFSYTVLTLVGEGGAGPHDFVRMMRQGRIYWSGAESHFYAEPKRLERLGGLTSRKKPGKNPEPATLPRIQHEAVVKLLAADLVEDAVVLESLAAMRADIADAAARLDVAEAVAATLPHRERYLRLVHGLGRRILDAHLDWLDDVERELGGQGKRAGRPVA